MVSCLALLKLHFFTIIVFLARRGEWEEVGCTLQILAVSMTDMFGPALFEAT